MKTLSKQDLKRMNEQEHEDFVLINVLPRDHFNEQHIRTSVNVPHDQLALASTVTPCRKPRKSSRKRAFPASMTTRAEPRTGSSTGKAPDRRRSGFLALAAGAPRPGYAQPGVCVSATTTGAAPAAGRLEKVEKGDAFIFDRTGLENKCVPFSREDHESRRNRSIQ